MLRAAGHAMSFTDGGSLSTQDVNCLINTEDYQRVTPLWLAVRYNDIDLTQQLLVAGANLNQHCGRLCMTPLHIATYNHNVDMVRLLLEAGANPNVLDRWNYTPLMYAAICYEPFVVDALFTSLIEHGCDVNYGATLDDDGQVEHNVNVDLPGLQSHFDGSYITYVREPMGPTSGTALHLAVQNPHLTNDSIDILLNANASVDKRNLYGQTPIMGAILDIFYEYHSQVKSHAEMLIRKGTDINAQDVRGWTGFHYAAQRGQMTCMQLLMEGGADSNITSHGGETPLWLLLVNGWRDAAKCLVMNGCNMNIPIKSTVVLAFNQNIEICRYGDILPIEFAICNRYYDVAELLLKAGCQIKEDTWLGTTGSMSAELFRTFQTKHEDFLKFLEDYANSKKSVSSLRECCRGVIRATMQQAICIKLDRLMLPQQIKDYICFRSG